MDISRQPSRNVVDKRAIARRGLPLLVAVFVAFFGGRLTVRDDDPDRDLVQLTSTALDRAQTFWSGRAEHWRDARVVLIERVESTPCGIADSESGPFYCEADERVYLDLSFLREIEGDLARAYVIAHEIGHHVQKLTASSARGVDLELEADCYAGVWVRSEIARGLVSDADVPAALAEAASVGDDRICPTCSPETWSHGSGEQRVAAFFRGLQEGSCVR